MASDTHDLSRDRFMLVGGLAQQGYDWWWHSFTAHHAITGEERAFFYKVLFGQPGFGWTRAALWHASLRYT